MCILYVFFLINEQRVAVCGRGSIGSTGSRSSMSSRGSKGSITKDIKKSNSSTSL